MKDKRVPIIQKDTEKDSRREFLKMAGKVTLYTPPAIIMLMHPNRDAVACISPHPRRGRRFRRRRRRRRRRY